MVTRIAVVVLAVVLVPVVTMAQAGGGTSVSIGGGAVHYGGYAQGGSFYGGGFGAGIPIGNLGRVAPFTGFGNVNHPGLGYAPNTPGIGFPLAPGIQPLPTVTQPFIGPIRPGATAFGPPVGPGYGGYGHHVHGYGCGHYGYGSPVFVTVPVAVPYPVVVNGYTYTSGPPQSPQVIIIGQPGPGQEGQPQAEDRPRHWPAPGRGERGADRDSTPIYETRPPVTEEKPAKPLTLLVFKDHTIIAVINYWKEGDRLHYVTSYGSKSSVSLDLLDLEFTRKLNDERNVKFEL